MRICYHTVYARFTFHVISLLRKFKRGAKLQKNKEDTAEKWWDRFCQRRTDDLLTLFFSLETHLKIDNPFEIHWTYRLAIVMSSRYLEVFADTIINKKSPMLSWLIFFHLKDTFEDWQRFWLRVTKYRSPKNDFVVVGDFHFANSD